MRTSSYHCRIDRCPPSHGREPGSARLTPGISGGALPCQSSPAAPWTGGTGGSQLDAAFALANGWGGPFILVVPAKRLVVTTAALTAGLSGTAPMAQWQRIFDILMLRVVRAF